MGKYFQKRKLSGFFTEIKIPKMEIPMDYVITSWDPLTIYGNSNKLNTLTINPGLQILMPYIS